MDRRTKTLAALFALAVAYLAVSGVVYPRWIEPFVRIQDTIAEQEKELAKLEEVEARVEWAKREFRAYAGRVGSFDMRRVENELRDRLNRLIETQELVEASVTPSRSTKDRKTGLSRMLLTVSAAGSLESAVGFVKAVEELPHVMRVLNVAIYPASGSGKGRRGKSDLVNLRVPIQVLVLPQEKLVGKIEPEDLVQPDEVVRHEGRSYAGIWEQTPFTEHVVLPPLVITAKKADATVVQGRRLTLDVAATGGDGVYQFLWTPDSGLDKAKTRRPRVSTSDAGARTYTCMVTDGRGSTASTSVNVTITEKSKPKSKLAEGPDGPEALEPSKVVDTGPKRWKDGKNMQLTMTLIRKDSAGRFGEVMIHDGRKKETAYYTVGDEFDGGELVFVHQTGALVRRQDEYRVYPIGEMLDKDMLVADAVDYPRLQRAAELHRAAVEALKPAEPEEAGPGDDDDEDDGDEPKSLDAELVSKAPDKTDIATGSGKAGTANGPEETPGAKHGGQSASTDAPSGSKPTEPGGAQVGNGTTKRAEKAPATPDAAAKEPDLDPVPLVPAKGVVEPGGKGDAAGGKTGATNQKATDGGAKPEGTPKPSDKAKSGATPGKPVGGKASGRAPGKSAVPNIHPPRRRRVPHKPIPVRGRRAVKKKD